jgi:cell cycle arrest protein BUB2
LFQNLNEILKLWDFFFAFGFHLIPVVLVSLIVSKRNEFLKMNESNIRSIMTYAPKTNEFFNEGFDSKKLIRLTINFIRELPNDILSNLDKHTYDHDFVNNFVKKVYHS